MLGPFPMTLHEEPIYIDVIYTFSVDTGYCTITIKHWLGNTSKCIHS